MSASLKIKDSNGRWVEVPEIHGESAYEGAVRQGYTGSESDFYYMLSNFSNAASLANTAAARAEAVLSSLPADYTDIWEVIAVDYQHLVLPIKVGTYCTYDGGVYECNTEITVAESFTAAHWTSRVIGNELSDLKSAFNQYREAEELKYTRGKYIDLSVGIGNVVNITPTPYYHTACAICECSEGDLFTVWGYGGSGPRLYGFLDQDKKLLVVSISGDLVKDGVLLIAPENAAYFVFNTNKDYEQPYAAYKGQYNKKSDIANGIINVGNEQYYKDGFQNIFNPNIGVANKYIKYYSGELYDNNDTFVTDPIFVPSDAQYISGRYKRSDGGDSNISQHAVDIAFYDAYMNFVGWAADARTGVAIPDHTVFMRICVTHDYVSIKDRLMFAFAQSLSSFTPYKTTNERFEEIEDSLKDKSIRSEGVSGRWYTGTAIGATITEGTAGGTLSIIREVSEGDSFIITGKGGSGGRAYYLLDVDSKIVELGDASVTYTNKYIRIPQGIKYFIAQTNSTSIFDVVVPSSITNIDKRVDILENEIGNINEEIEIISAITPDKLLTYWTCDTKYGISKLERIKVTETGFVDIGFIGDSWTQSTGDNIDSGKFESYVKWLSKKLWEKFGFGGLGWLDFARDHGNGKMFGCADLYDHWTYEFAGTVTGVDGTDGGAANCYGICVGHTVFSNGASLTLTFDAGYLDKFKIAYYKDAHFTVSINDGQATEITANSSDGWQTTELGTIGTDTVKVVITALADDCIVFGMNCSYGTNGVRCHKIGNRSASLSTYLGMNEAQFEAGLSSLNLSWVSLLFAINDMGSSDQDSKCVSIINNFTSFINRVKIACTRSSLMSCDISLLGCADISATSYIGLQKLEGYEKKFAFDNGYGWVSTRECIGVGKEELTETGLFSDTIHLNKIGSKIYGEYIFKWLFESVIGS